MFSLLAVLLLCFSGGELSASLKPEGCYEVSDTPSNNSEVEVCRDDSCPPGLFCEDGRCHCGHNPPRLIRCNGTSSSSMLNCHCATLDEETNTTLVGNCIYNCGIKRNGSSILYSPLPTNIHQLNTACEPLNRRGALCGRCKQDHYLLAYSFNWTCVQCPHARSNWVWYIMAAYLPLTAFCMAILFFKVNIASSHFYPVIVLCQLLSVSAFARLWVPQIDQFHNVYIVMMFRIVLSLYGVWNLDFFRPFYSNLCLGLDILPTLALDYAIAVYPLLLMVITYLLIVLYDKNCRIVTLMWRPFRRVFSLLGRDWNIRTSVIDAFSTFLLLSNLKFLSVSFDILVFMPVFHLHGTHYNITLGLFYAPDIVYFGKEHYSFAVLAIFCLCIFVVIPIALLLVYPLSLFQKLLNLIPVRWFILHTFMDSCQGVYKDGTEAGTRDCRWFSCIYLLVNFIGFMLYGVTLSVLFFSLATIVFTTLAFLFLSIQPFKASVNHYNLVHAFLNSLIAVAVVCIAAVDVPGYVSDSLHTVLYTVVSLLFLFPLIYTTSFILCQIYRQKRSILNKVRRLKAWKNGYGELLDSGGEDILSDRIKNPSAYPDRNLSSFPSPPQS